MVATPSKNKLPLRSADFSNLAEALDYAAEGDTGCNFYTGSGELYTVLPYRELRQQAMALARRLRGLGLQRGARVALIAETHPDFLRFFFACQYVGLVPVPLPVSINLGSHKAYVRQLRELLISCKASIAIAPTGFVPFAQEAAEDLGLAFLGDVPTFMESFPDREGDLCPLQPGEIAYLQYTSGSTRFPRGVMITQQAVLSNLAGIIKHGVKIRPGDRCVSWLPYYHDMGLVGLILVPVASQMSVDYLGTREFAMRPRQWLALMTRNQATISFSPPFGYELCARRLRPDEMSKFDLSRWRVAGVGAETIRSESLLRFAKMLAPSGFDEKAFLACYGMAECSLAVSFAPLDQGLAVDCVDSDYLSDSQKAMVVSPDGEDTRRISKFVNCGDPLPGYQVALLDNQGNPLPERHIGTIFVQGPSVMSGYFEDPAETQRTLSADGWLDTGDVGYRVGESLFITGRQKDLIIINGRNIWPQDLEYIAEQQPEVRPGDALAFAVPSPSGEDATILVVQCRQTDTSKRADLVDRLQKLIREELAIECFIELVPLHTLPRTSSGKLSRSKARQNFIEKHQWHQDAGGVLKEPQEFNRRAG
jgi:fatty-acyl-CoA synthase